MNEIVLPRPIAFVFSAGIARSAAEVGMLQALLEAGVKPDLVVGSSFGAVNAAAVAVQLDGCADRLREFWLGLAADRSWTSRFLGVLRTLTSNRSQRSAELFREHLLELLGDYRLDAGDLPGCCVATDLVTGLAVEIDAGPAVEAVLTAAAVPVLLSPVEKDQQVLVDGGVVAAAPIRAAQVRQAGSVILLDVGASAREVGAVAQMRWYEIGALAYAHIVRGQTGAVLAQAAQELPVVVISNSSGDFLDFSNPAELIEQGYAAARERLTSLPSRITRPGLYGIPAGMELDHRLESVLVSHQSHSEFWRR